MNKSEFEFKLDFNNGDRLLIGAGGHMRYDRVLSNGKRDNKAPIGDNAAMSRTDVPQDGKNMELTAENRYRLYHQVGEKAYRRRLILVSPQGKISLNGIRHINWSKAEKIPVVDVKDVGGKVNLCMPVKLLTTGSCLERSIYFMGFGVISGEN